MTRVQGTDQAQGSVSIVELKNLARTLLPSTSVLRDLILSEADSLPAESAAVKAQVYSRLLYRELQGPRK